MSNARTMKHFQVDSGIPRVLVWSENYPFQNMDKGDSFAVPEDVKVSNVRSAASKYAKRHDWMFTIQKTATGYRCWRIA